MNWNLLFRCVIIGPPGRLVFWTRVSGRENLPKGPYVLAFGPHKTYKETIVIPIWLWRRQMHFLVNTKYWKNRTVGWFLTATGQIKVGRGADGKLDSITPAVRDLKAGYVLGIFPEGTRHKEDALVHRGHGGVIVIAQRAGVPIIPVGLHGMDSNDLRTRRELRIGRPFYVNTSPVFEQVDNLMKEIAWLSDRDTVA